MFRLPAAILAMTCCLAPWMSARARAADKPYDVIIRGGTIYDGSGGKPITGDVAIRGDRIVAVGDLKQLTGATDIDADCTVYVYGTLTFNWIGQKE